MAKPLVPDELWMLIEPLLPPERPKPKGGRPAIPHRAALSGIILVLKSGLPWEMLPQEMGCGSGMTCWRRLRDWQAAGVWTRLHRVLLDRLGRVPSVGAAPAGTVPLFRPKGGEETGPNPTDRGRAGSKRHLITDAKGVPLALRLTAANIHDSRLFAEPIDAVPPIRHGVGRPQRRPAKLPADKGYDFPRCRTALRRRAIQSCIARRGIESSERLGRHRWVIERTLAWWTWTCFGKVESSQ
jgi:transposase